MRSRNVMFTLVLLIAIFLLAIYKKRQEQPPKEAFNRTPTRLYFYAVAKCQMQCQDIGEGAIKTLMQTGVINLNQSSRFRQPCPIFALQGRVHQRYLRVLFEQCRNGTFVSDCSDLEHDTDCDCTNDYPPKQN